jgi:hypothetical protein
VLVWTGPNHLSAACRYIAAESLKPEVVRHFINTNRTMAGPAGHAAKNPLIATAFEGAKSVLRSLSMLYNSERNVKHYCQLRVVQLPSRHHLSHKLLPAL